ncbi:hypothetical protein BC831DRAFT_456537 [Entophlyctis helioformis]|nr:hypothetical protein BC831DRAFT_456537 [Entophlyctis helioformis]
MTALILGGSGRVGLKTITQLLERGVSVRAIVRSPAKLPATLTSNPLLTIIHKDVLSISPSDMVAHINGCDSVICCLGHEGITSKPARLVLEACQLVCSAIEMAKPARPIKFILLNAAGVDNTDGTDPKRRFPETTVLFLVKAFVTPFLDSEASAHHFSKTVGKTNPYIEWCVLRCYTFIEGPITEYDVHPVLSTSILAGKEINMANIAHFKCELALNDQTWAKYKNTMPLLLNKQSK